MALTPLSIDDYAARFEEEPGYLDFSRVGPVGRAVQEELNAQYTVLAHARFGALDADTLDDVMDRLDGLRAGGRTVGVVSHVSELRSRIPTQVLVDKGRAGSSVTVTTLVG